jgi:uncharacterized protein with FMN-binding domain
MKRIVTWLLSTISVVVLLFGYHTSTAGSLAASPQTSVVSGGKAATTTSGTGGGSGSGGSGSNAGSGNGSASGGGSGSASAQKQSSTVTGPTVNTQWGPVQVQLTVKGGTITDVSVLKYPNANGRDIQIANYALPILIQDTLDAQSANINMVSGATFTSYGYLQSLQGALDQAQL